MPLSSPGFHKQVLLPLTVRIVELPEQILALATLRVVVELTKIVKFAGTLTQTPLLPDTVYTVVMVGFNTCVEPVNAPGFQV
jgi:hypothetical protein